MFHWTRRMPYWRTWSFLANQSFLGKTITKYKVIPPSEKIFIKFFFWSHGFCFWHPCWKLLPQIRNFFILNQKKNVKLIFFKKHFCLKAFLWIYGQRCWQLRFNCFGKKPAIFHSLPISQTDLVSAKFSPLSAPLRWTGRKPSWFVQFFFEVFADAKVAYSKPLANSFSTNTEVFR